jgi:hypothetical protein
MPDANRGGAEKERGALALSKILQLFETCVSNDIPTNIRLWPLADLKVDLQKVRF